MIRSHLRHVAVAFMAALVIGSLGAAPASAGPPPVPSGTYLSCQSGIPAGYSVNLNLKWAWDGRLQWEVCIARTSSGTHYAIFRLSSPSNLSAQFDRYTGIQNVYLQKCVNGVYTTVAWMDANHTPGPHSVGPWEEPYRITAVSNSGGRYYFKWVQTPSTGSSANSYRVRISGYGAVVPRNGGSYFSLSQGPHGPLPGQNPGVYTSGCRAP
jgi:hypothetical protein